MSKNLRRLTIETNDQSVEWLAQHAKDIDHLVGLVLEMFEDKPVTLLSPVFRELIIDHAKKVKRQRGGLAGMDYYVDNMSRELKELETP